MAAPGSGASVGVYGEPLHDLVDIPTDASRFSPLAPAQAAIEQADSGAFSRFIVAAPPGVLERRFVLAHALRALEAGGELVALAPKDMGGARLRRELEGFDCVVEETARRHHRICTATRPAEPIGLEDAIAEGGLQIAEDLGLWTQPGIFSWDRIDPGTTLLLASGLKFKGDGADFGCGVGLLAREVLRASEVTTLALIDIDARAIQAARRNIDDPRASFLQHDLRSLSEGLKGLDFVVMNPPFHTGGREDRGLGQAFVRSAAAALRRGGLLRLVANIGLPYEAVLAEAFREVKPLSQKHGYKLIEARK